MLTDEENAKPYASALLGAAVDLACLEQVQVDLTTLQHEWEALPELRNYAALHDSAPREDHRMFATQMWKDRVHSATFVLVEQLTLQGQLHLLPFIIKKFRELAVAHAGITAVQATFALAPNPQALDQLKQRLEATYGPIALTTTEDPSLIAGAVFQVGDTRIDASLKGRLARLRHATQHADKQ